MTTRPGWIAFLLTVLLFGRTQAADIDLSRFARYDGSDLRPVFKPGSGHPSFRPGGRYIVTDAYPNEPVALGDGTVPIRLIDTKTATCTNIARIFVSAVQGEYRVDPHPAWDPSGRYVVFNGLANNTRKVYIADLSHALKTKLQITTFAGTGQPGYGGDGGPAIKARLNGPFGLVRGPDGALYVCDTMNHAIRRVGADGTITTVAGCGRKGYSGDGRPATKAELFEPYEIRFDRAGHMFFVEMRNNIVRRVDARTHIISTVAGSGKAGFGGDGGPAIKALMKSPHSIQFGPDGALYICDIGNHRIRKVDLRTGVITTFAGTGQRLPTPDGAKIAGTPLDGPRAIDFDARGDMWLALREGNRVFRLDMQAGTIHHVAGTGKTGFTGNGGPAKDATLSGPKGIAVAPNGNVYLADTESHSVRMIDVKRGTLELVAGTGQPGDGLDGDPLACRMNRLHGIFVDADGAVFVGDTLTHRVRVIQTLIRPRSDTRPGRRR